MIDAQAQAHLAADPRLPGSPHRAIWLRYVLALTIVLGIFFRFYHLDRKTFWEDEILGTIHTLGYSEAQIVEASPRMRVAADLQTYFRLPEVAQDTLTGLKSTVESLAAEDPQHPPLYYLLNRLWAQAFGTSVAALRALPALFGLLALFAMYGLAKELFASRSIAWLSVALLAVSPFQILYSQEAREYTLWSACILVSSALLLRAGRTRSVLVWVAYAASLAVSLYVFPFSVLLIAGHAAYLISIGAYRVRRLTIGFLASGGVALLAFAPWARIMLASNGLTHGMSAILATKKSPLAVGLDLLKDLRTSLFDFGFFRIGPFHSSAVNTAATLAALALAGYAGYILARSGPRNAALFVLLGMTFPALALFAHDIVFGGGLVEQGRYLMPIYLAVALALAYLFDVKVVRAFGGNSWWTATLILTLAGEVASCVLSANARTWWNKDYERTPAVAAIVNAARLPLVVSDQDSSRVLGLGYYLKPNVALNLRLRCDQCDVTLPAGKDQSPESNGFSDVFILGNGEAQGSTAHVFSIGVKTFPSRTGPLDMFTALE